MAWIDPRYVAYQAKRFIRPDWERYMRPDWRDRKYWVGEPPDNPFGLPNGVWAAANPAPAPANLVEHKELERERRELQYELAKLRADWELLKFELRGQKVFNPNQPRLPAGSPEGGRWTSDQVLSELSSSAPGSQTQAGTIRAFSQTRCRKPGRRGHSMRRAIHPALQLI